MHLAELEIISDFFPIPLGSFEVILGYQWLTSLGEFHMNWAAMTMKFKVGETRVQLQGDPSLCKTQVSLRSMMRTIQLEGKGILLDFGQLTLLPINRNIQTKEITLIPPAVTQLLDKYLEIFANPLGLPPAHDRDHAIVLKEGSSTISFRPYRLIDTER